MDSGKSARNHGQSMSISWFLVAKMLATGHLVAPADHRAIGPQQSEGLAQPTAEELGRPAKKKDKFSMMIRTSFCVCLHTSM